MPRGTIVSNGRAGYLQMGPGIPMKPGTYRARWIGTVTDPGNGPLGFVDVWAGDRLVARRQVYGSDIRGDQRQLAEIPFVLSEPTDDLDYRVWIDGRHPVRLERVELFSDGAVPPQTSAASPVN